MNTRRARSLPGKKRRSSRTWVPILSDTAAEKKIIELHKKSAPYREITSLTHRSPNAIKRVLELHEKSHVPPNESKRSAALRLLNQGKTRGEPRENRFLAVAIALDLTPQEVEGYYLDLMQLKCMHEFVKLYDRIKDILPDSISFHKSCESRGLTIADLYELKAVIDKSQEAKSNLSQLSIECEKTQKLLDHKVRLLKDLEFQERDLEDNLSMMSRQREILAQQLSDSKSIIDSIKSQDTFQEAERILQEEVDKILDSNSELINSALASTIITFGKNPFFQELLYPPSDEFRGKYLLNEFQRTVLPILETLRSRIQKNAIENIHYGLKKRDQDDSL